MYSHQNFAVILAAGFLSSCALKPVTAPPPLYNVVQTAQLQESGTASVPSADSPAGEEHDDGTPDAEEVAAQIEEQKVTPLVESRGPASLPLIPIAPPKSLYAPESQPEYNLTCSEFFKMLETTQPSTVEEVLQSIQKIRPKFLTRTVFAYETRMAFDGASLLYPRSIVYGGDAKVILNFGGHNRQLGHDRMETICFDDKENKFDFYDIVFPKESPVQAAAPDATTTSNSDVAALNSIALTAEEKLKKYVTIPNGRGVRTCSNCHGTPSRPVWDTFAVWPGFYGAADDALQRRRSLRQAQHLQQF